MTITFTKSKHLLSLEDIFGDQNYCELFNFCTCVKSVMTLNNIFLILTSDLSLPAEIKLFPISSFLPAFILSFYWTVPSSQADGMKCMKQFELFNYLVMAC